MRGDILNEEIEIEEKEVTEELGKIIITLFPGNSTKIEFTGIVTGNVISKLVSGRMLQREYLLYRKARAKNANR